MSFVVLKNRHWVLGVSVLALAGFVESASAVTVNFKAPTQWVRGSAAFSTYQQWDAFTDANISAVNTPNSPGVPVGSILPFVAAAPFNPYGTANVSATTAGSFITSGGNIYSIPFAEGIAVDVPTYNFGAVGGWTTIILQTRTTGSLVDYSSFKITSGGADYFPQSARLFFDQVTGVFGPGAPVSTSTTEERFMEFQIPNSAASYTITFKALDPSMSLDNVSVDTVWTASASPIFEPLPVPEPATFVLVGLGFLSFAPLMVRRRR